jgi:hypothetical protein
VAASRLFPVGFAAVGGLFVALTLLSSSVGGTAVPGLPATGPVLQVSGNGPCTTPTLPVGFSGTVGIEGGPLAASSVEGIEIAYSYFVEVNVTDEPYGTLASENCTLETGSALTNASGGFAVRLGLPPTTCSSGSPSGETCTSYSGPFRALSVGTPDVPDGYGLAASESGATFALEWVADLTALSMSPAPPNATLASGASADFVARPEMANGSTSPVAPTFSWSLGGAGYRFLSSPDGDSATVVAGPGWSNGSLRVRASVTVGTSTFSTANVTVALTTVPLAISDAVVNRTVVDAGGTVELSVNATGAAAYSYTLSVGPGLARASSLLPCRVGTSGSASATVRCTAELAFPTPGTGSVSVNVSNGVASATWVSPSITVAPSLTLALSPAAPVGYAGASLPVVLRAGSGVGPYLKACLAPGFGGPICLSGAGPSYSFAPTYPAPGNYTAQAWLIDATGANSSVPADVRVVGPLTVGTLRTSNASLSAGVPTLLSAFVAGGVLPATAWWNLSGSSGPIATAVVTADGLLSAEFDPLVAGTAVLSLTVADALGTVSQTRLAVRVGPGPVAAVTPVPSPTNSPTEVGRPVGLRWQAFDAFGEAVPTFAAPVDLVVRTASGVAALSWVNLSGLGPLSLSPEGSFAIPSSAWVAGELSLTLAPAEAGTLSVALEGSALPGGAALLNLTATPDLDHLRLYDPEVVVAGTWSNRTFWHVTDRFGDPAPGAFVTVQYTAPGVERDLVLPVAGSGAGGTGVWVNYTMPPDPSASLRILDQAGDVLYGPVAPLAGADRTAPLAPLADAVGAVGLVAGVGAGASGYVRRRRALLPRPRSEEEELLRLAEGRAELVEILGGVGVADAARLRAAWTRDPPPVEELKEWLASLVADGTLSEAPGPGDRPEYALRPPADDAPRVVVDEAALERAVAVRDAAVREDPTDATH